MTNSVRSRVGLLKRYKLEAQIIKRRWLRAVFRWGLVAGLTFFTVTIASIIVFVPRAFGVYIEDMFDSIHWWEVLLLLLSALCASLFLYILPHYYWQWATLESYLHRLKHNHLQCRLMSLAGDHVQFINEQLAEEKTVLVRWSIKSKDLVFLLVKDGLLKKRTFYSITLEVPPRGTRSIKEKPKLYVVRSL